MTWIQGWLAQPYLPLWATEPSEIRLLCCTYHLTFLRLYVTNNLFLHILPSESQERCPYSLPMKEADCLSGLPALRRVGKTLKDTFSHKIALSAFRLSSFPPLFFPYSRRETVDKLIPCSDGSSRIKSPGTSVKPVLKLDVTWRRERRRKKVANCCSLLRKGSC